MHSLGKPVLRSTVPPASPCCVLFLCSCLLTSCLFVPFLLRPASCFLLFVSCSLLLAVLPLDVSCLSCLPLDVLPLASRLLLLASRLFPVCVFPLTSHFLPVCLFHLEVLPPCFLWVDVLLLSCYVLPLVSCLLRLASCVLPLCFWCGVATSSLEYRLESCTVLFRLLCR